MRHRLFLATAFAVTALPLCAQGSGTANLRVLDCNGGPVTNCKISVLRHFQESGCLVKVPLLTDLELGPRDFLVDVANIVDLPSGEFVIQVEAEMHALTRSEPFTITSEARAADVDVRLARGTTITGTVYGADGMPLAGATVATLEPLELAVGWRIRPNNLPVTITLTSTVTDKGGHFRLANVAKGTYRITTTHRGHCTATRAVKVLDQRSLELADTKLRRGTELFGTCLFGAKPEAGLNVWVMKPGDPAAAWGTKTDAHGRWRIGERLPPGHYAVHAYQEGLADNPFEWLRQTKFSEQKVTIGADPTRIEKSLVIPEN